MAINSRNTSRIHAWPPLPLIVHHLDIKTYSFLYHS